jgi:hypothetical protein
MAFVRKKMVKRYSYYQLVQSHRVDGKPRQTVLMHLSQHPTVDAALAGWPKEIRQLRRLAKQHSERYEFLSKEFGNKRSTRYIQECAESATQQADALQARLTKLRSLRKDGVA